MSSLLKRQAKDLLSLVGEMQDYNSPVPAYCLGSIRDLLRNFSHCAHVEIVGDVQVVPTYALDRVLLSAFILSQLDSQKLTSRDSPRVVITPGLGFVLDFLAPPPSRETGHPVLITWYSSPSHRRYLLLAHIDRHMATRGYSLEELQQLRQANAANIIAKRISQDPDLGEPALKSATDLTDVFFVSR